MSNGRRALGCGLILATFALVAVADEAPATEPERDENELRLRSLETEFLDLVYYNPNHEYLVPHLARSFENSLAFHRRLFDYTPSEPIVMLLHDFGDYGHGGTSTVPWNYVTIGIEPFDYVFETMPANERMNWLMHHELMHVVGTDRGAGIDNTFRKIFTGKVAPTADQPLSMIYSWLTSPRWYSPRWYHEGIATFLETWMAGGLGRVLGGYDEMVFRTMVLEDRTFYDIVGLESEGTTIDFQVGQNSYLYGTRFMSYLGLRYGPEKLLAWFNRTEESKRSFSAQFREVYGRSVHDEWARWHEWERDWQRKNLDALQAFPITRDTPVLEQTLGSVSRSHHDPQRNAVYVAINYPGSTAQIAAIDLSTGAIRKLVNVNGPALYYVTSVAWDPASDTIFYTSDNTQGWRDLNALDVTTGNSRRLLKDCRIGNLVVNPADSSLWGVQHHDGLSTIVRLPAPYDAWETLLTLEYGTDVYDLDVSPDGETLVAGMIRISGAQSLIRLGTESLRRGDASFETLVEFETTSPQNFVFDDSGRWLYGSSYYTGVSNLFRVDVDSGELEALTNADSGYFRPLPLTDNRLLAYRYTADGFVPVTLPIEVLEDVNAIDYLGQAVFETHPELAEWNAGSPARVDLDERVEYRGDYKVAKRFRLASVYPVVEGYKDEAAVGARLNFADPVGLHNLNVTAAYTPGDDLPSTERLHLLAEYDHVPWSIRIARNASDFYDLFGPTKVGRKGTAIGVSFSKSLVDQRPHSLDYTLNVSSYSDLDALPSFQNVPATVDSFESFSGSLRYRSMRGTIGGVERERGIGAGLALQSNYVDDELQTRTHLDVDLGVPTGIDHSSLWFRSSFGWSFGDETSNFSNFYFGGFGNNWVDHQSIRRYREHYAFPGVELNEIEANNYGKLMIEWVLPPIRYKSVGWPGFYVNWTQFTLFATGLVANPHPSPTLPRREFGSAGAQVDFKLVLFSTLESTLSIGYAFAGEPGTRRTNEFMASLKILR